jgi:hypothetical protein
MTTPTLIWTLTWTDGKQYAGAVDFPPDPTYLPLLERDIVKAGGKSWGDSAEAIGMVVGHQIEFTVRGLAGVDEDAAADAADIEDVAQRYRAALASRA